MKEFLLELQAVYEKISQNQIDRLEPGLSADDVISAYRNTCAALRSLRLSIERILNENLFPMLENIAGISHDDESELYTAAQKISAYESRADPVLALKIYQGLLQWAREKKDDAKILKYLYWCGITLYFFSQNERDRILAYFKEGASYIGKYRYFDDPEARKYIHRCLGNTSMLYYYMEDIEKAKEVDETAFNFWNRLLFSGVDPDFPWLNYFLTCLTHRHALFSEKVHSNPDSETKEVLKQLLETAITINKLYNKNRESFRVFGGTRYEYILWEAQFLNGLISFDMLHGNVEKKKAEFASDDYSPDAMYVKHDLNLYLMFYATAMQRLSGIKDEAVAALSADTIDYFSKIPKSVDPRDVSRQLLNSVKHISSALGPTDQLDFVLKLTTLRHIPTCAHSIMTGKIAAYLTEYLIRKNPRCFVGFFGITHADQVRNRARELRQFVETCGLCHDIGKISYIINPYIHARNLTDDDIGLIKRHPADGAAMLAREDGKTDNDGYAEVIAGHHKHYDNTGGYPAEFDMNNAKYRIVIDILAAADSIDAATDDIAKTYAAVKTLDAVCDEIIAESGSRYSPIAADALRDEEVRKALARILNDSREAAYYTAYLHAWS